ncbi:unnamed protein product [Cylicocyclus nassatus]|uniref:Uncharacterized protein n=1 Tax=Cylicocyclus nassatus TaxID=53992 RepID=A0AA36GTV5_CYLNA|nr:unnamed protein product [Cylicocyclus nassatus]
MFKLFTVTITLTLCVASTYGVKIEVTIKPSSKANCNEHTESDDRLIIDFISIFETDTNGLILSGGIMPVGESFLKNGISKTHDYTEHPKGTMVGPVLRSERTSKYHIILHVRAKTIKYDDGIFYYYRESLMKWGESEDKHTEQDDTTFHQSPFLPGQVTVKLNGQTVLSVADGKNFCYNMYSWIPQHGMYRLNATTHEWIYMFYYPIQFPSVLS